MKISKSKLLTGLLAAGMLFGLGAQNLIRNSNFENGVSEWKPPTWKRGDNKTWLVPVADSAKSQGPGGSTSMRLDWTNNTICYLWYHKEIQLPKEKELELSFWMRAAGYTTFNQVALTVIFRRSKITGKTLLSCGHRGTVLRKTGLFTRK
jgi:hypothetical protein